MGIALASLVSAIFFTMSLDKLMIKVSDQQIILKRDIELLTKRKLNGYENRFVGQGTSLQTGSLKTGLMQGIRNDTIFDVLVVFKNGYCIGVIEHAHSTFFRVDSTIHEVLLIGEMNTIESEDEPKCIKAFLLTYRPIGLDTLSSPLFVEYAEILDRTVRVYCH